MLKPKISKEEVNGMPVVVFGGKITVVDEDSRIHEAVAYLRQFKVVGIDTETKPSFARGQSHKVALLQISTDDHCFLFRLNKIKLSIELADFLADKKIKKIGLALRDDMVGLNKHHYFKPESLIDLQSIVKEYGILELGLQKIFAILFGQKISKSQRLTNWESHDLTDMQQRYAATDAWAVLKIYQQLSEENKLTKKQLEELIISQIAQQKQETVSVDDQSVNV